MNVLPTAVFLDRDGTLIEDAHYISRPEQVRLIEGAAEAIARINAVVVPVIVVTNQSGIGRGHFTVEDYERVSARLDDLLAEHGARIDASYHCPHKPEDDCLCRKPGTLLYERAAADNPGIDLSRALYMGDRMRDVIPAKHFGGHGVLIPSADTPPADLATANEVARVAPSLATALDWHLCAN